jgi:predicted nucleic acid-binding protein
VPQPATVSDTGPLIALAKVDLLPLLKSLFGTVQIAPAVYRELLAGKGDDVARLQLTFGDYIQIVAVPPAREAAASARDLGAGEQEAIALALYARALLLVDDHAARVAASAVGVPVTGTVGVVIRAKETGILPAVSPVLARMRANGYWLSDGLLAAAARMAGE